MGAKSRFLLVFCLLFAFGNFPAVAEELFIQDMSVKIKNAADLEGAKFIKVEVDKDGVVFVLTDRGVARLFGDTLALDRSFRPLAKRKAIDITVHEGKLFYLYEDEVLSNGFAGRPLYRLPAQATGLLAFDGTVGIRVSGTNLTMFNRSMIRERAIESPVIKIFPYDEVFYLLGGNVLRQYPFTEWHGSRNAEGSGNHREFPEQLTAMAVRKNAFYLATTNGFYEFPEGLQKSSGILHTNLPHSEITAICPTENGIWFGTTRGIFRWNRHGPSRYLASQRWLKDDAVADLKADPNGNLVVLTKTGLTRIEFRPMTLSQKAAHYQNKIRQRHIRFGFCSELLLGTPGDPTTAEMIDTDNDGTWSNYYMASMAFRYGATGDEEARRHAWETFEALERLEEINPLDGFPSRTFERTGFKYSDPERWHPTEDGKWDWKAHTSSDEIIAHAFGTTVMYQVLAKTKGEKDRLTRFLKAIADHIIRNNWYLIDVDNQPTLWGRWNPEYVNWFPPSIVDRKLNSAEIIGLLQSVYQMTGDEHYQKKAYELINNHGYLENIVTPMEKIALTAGFIHKGNDMGDSWNHSDDLLSFVSYWVLYHTAFNQDLKTKYAAVIKDHWQIERHEQNPIWAFVYGSTGAREFGRNEALFTLHKFPLDMVAWDVRNSHRKDISTLPPSFRGEQMREFLPPDERQITRWNTQPFILDGGTGGRIEFGGDEFLLPYWMGRYYKLLSAD